MGGLYEKVTVLAFRPHVEVVDLTHDNMEIEEFDRLDAAANVLIERLQKLEEDRDGLAEAVFEKIRKEYDHKLREAERRLKAKRKALTRKLRDMEEAKAALERRRGEIDDEIKECEVRRKLGEYDDALYETHHAERSSDQELVGRKIDVLGRNIRYYRRALAKEKDSFPCAACGSLNLIWEKRCKECGSDLEDAMAEELAFQASRIAPEVPETDAGVSSPDPETSSAALERTLIRDLESIDAALAEEEENLAAPAVARPCLLRIQGPNAGESFVIQGAEIAIGKAPENQVSIPEDRALSRRHAKIVFEGERPILYDLGSTNGTAVNGRAVEVSPLEDHDEIAMGSSIYRFCG